MRYTSVSKSWATAELLSCATFAFTLACARQQTVVADQPVTLRTIDSAWTNSTWEWMGDGNWLYRVEVGRGGRVDTIANIIEPAPFVVDNDRVAGLQLVPKDTGQSGRSIFIYSANNRKIRSWPVPDDVLDIYFDVMISPDARYVAYVANGWDPVVREIATNRVVLRDTTEGGGCECDVDRNHARWVNADSVEIVVAHHVKAPEGWFLMAGRPSTKAVHVKMLDTMPNWPGH
jgi:hypothetical protein